MESLLETECAMMRLILPNAFMMEAIVAQAVSTKTFAQNVCAMKKVHFYLAIHVCIDFLFMSGYVFSTYLFFKRIIYILITNSWKVREKL